MDFPAGQSGQAALLTEFKAFLTDLSNPTKGAGHAHKALQKATFGDTSQGQFLEAIADKGLLALADHFGHVTVAAGKALDVLNGGLIKKLQDFVNQRLDLAQIRKAASDTDFASIDQWLQNRLANFLDHTLKLDDLKDIQKAIATLETKAADYYKSGVQALTKRYSFAFAATYQSTTSDTALIDVDFDLSIAEAATLFAEVAAQSSLDSLLTKDTNGVTLHQARLTHDITRQSSVELNLPMFNFRQTHVNDAIATLTAEEQAGRVLLYQVDAKDNVTAASRASSQLSVLASMKVTKGQPPRLDSSASIAYEMRQVKADMRPVELEARTTDHPHVIKRALRRRRCIDSQLLHGSRCGDFGGDPQPGQPSRRRGGVDAAVARERRPLRLVPRARCKPTPRRSDAGIAGAAIRLADSSPCAIFSGR